MVTSDPNDIPSSSHAAAAAPARVEKCDAPERKGSDECDTDAYWRRQCGCLRTSEKLRLIIKKFPSPAPPPPSPTAYGSMFDSSCISYRTQLHQQAPFSAEYRPLSGNCLQGEGKTEIIEKPTRVQRVLGDLVQLVQLTVAATALLFYYLIYCYMQLIYYTLRSAMYFHDADGPMKITIGVVTVTSLVLGFNVLLRLEKLIGIIY